LFYCLLPIAFLLSSCQSKTKKLLVKKWDCVQVENVSVADKNFQTAQDSAVAVKVEAALKTLSWTFNSNNSYQCSVNNSVVTQGTYKITDDESNLICTPESKTAINNYRITTLNEDELILTSTGITVPVIMHFRPH
jgi:hypothetical protein